MKELKKLKMENRRIAIENQQALEWCNKNPDIVKRELGNMYRGEEIRALWKDYTTLADLRPLAEKIHWTATPERLQAHIEGLRLAGYISYTGINGILNGDETPRTVKGIRGAGSEDRIILYIFGIWWHRKLIDEAFYSTDGRDKLVWKYQDFIMKSFARRDGKAFKHLRTAAKPDRGGFERKGDSFTFRDKNLHAALSKILK